MFLGIVCVEGTLANGWLIAFARLLSVGKCPGMIKETYPVFTYVGLRASHIYGTTDKQASIEEAGPPYDARPAEGAREP